MGEPRTRFEVRTVEAQAHSKYQAAVVVCDGRALGTLVVNPAEVAALRSRLEGEEETLGEVARLLKADDQMRQWAQRLIAQLPADHDGAASWLMNHGRGERTEQLRRYWEKLSGRKFSKESRTPVFNGNAPALDTADSPTPTPSTPVASDKEWAAQVWSIEGLGAMLNLPAVVCDRIRAEIASCFHNARKSSTPVVEALVEALDDFMQFDVSMTFDAKGSYSRRKSEELSVLRARGSAALALARPSQQEEAE